MGKYQEERYQSFFSPDRLFLAVVGLKKHFKIEVKALLFSDISSLVKQRMLVDVAKGQKFLQELSKNVTGKKKPDICDLCLPDSYFLTKVISVAEEKSGKDELKQFISEKAEEFLPSAPKELYLRWAVIGKRKQKKENLVLLAGITKKHLDPILAMFQQQKIYIRQVKPLSFLISTIINKFEENNYILQSAYGSELTTAVFINKKPAFITHTFFDPKALSFITLDNELAKVNQFIAGLGEDASQKLWLAGFSQKKHSEIIKNLSAKKWKVSLLEEKVSFDKPQDQNMAVLLTALAAFDLTGDSLNFTPKSYQKSYAKESFLRHLEKSLYIFIVAFLILLAFLAYFCFNFYFTLKIENTTLDSVKNSRISDTAKKVEQEAVGINKKTQTLTALYNQKTRSAVRLEQFYQLVPAGIKITSVDYSVEAKTIKAKGTAFSRQDLLALRENLAKLGAVSLPITSFVKNKDLGFSLTINLNN